MFLDYMLIKYIRSMASGISMTCMDMAEDPYEANNLIREPAYKGASEKLYKARLD